MVSFISIFSVDSTCNAHLQATKTLVQLCPDFINGLCVSWITAGYLLLIITIGSEKRIFGKTISIEILPSFFRCRNSFNHHVRINLHVLFRIFKVGDGRFEMTWIADNAFTKRYFYRRLVIF